MRLYLAVIDREDPYPPKMYAGWSHEAVRQEVYDWVKGYWDLEDEQIPTDQEEAIFTYFDDPFTTSYVYFNYLEIDNPPTTGELS